MTDRAEQRAGQLRRTLGGAGRHVAGVVGRTLLALEAASRGPPDLAIVDVMFEIDVGGLPDRVLEQHGTEGEILAAVGRCLG